MNHIISGFPLPAGPGRRRKPGQRRIMRYPLCQHVRFSHIPHFEQGNLPFLIRIQGKHAVLIAQNGYRRHIQPANQVARLRAIHPLFQTGQLHIRLPVKPQRIFISQHLTALPFYIFPGSSLLFQRLSHSLNLRFQITGRQHHVVSRLQCLQTDIAVAGHAFHRQCIGKNQSFESQFLRQ